MARSEEALANRMEASEAGYVPAFYHRAEKPRAFFRHPIDRSKPQDSPEQKLFRPANEKLLRGYILADVVAVVLGFICGWLLAAQFNAAFMHRYTLAELSSRDAALLAGQFMLLGIGMIIWFGQTSHYQLRVPFWMETKKIVETVGFMMLLSCCLLFLSKADLSRIWLLSCWGFTAFGIIVLRSLLRMYWRNRGQWQIPTLIIGSGPTAQEARDALHSEPNLGYQTVAHIKDLPAALHATGNSWSRLCQAHYASHVVIALAGDDFINARPLLAQLMREHIPFSVAPPMHNLSVFGMVPQCFMGHDVMLLVRNSGLDRPISRFIKRSFDVVLSSLALLMLSPLLLTLTLIVKMDGGPAFYKHRRIGLNGKDFACFKFRSMMIKSSAALKEYLAKNPQAQAEWIRDHKLRRDPRVTWVGAILRRLSFDELPQLFNVLKGEMSIVGPRPIIVAEAEKYDSDIAFYYRVRPGITGLWQVSGRNDVSYAERVRMDSWYVRNWSLWHDITIICKTFAVVIKQRGAY